MLKPNKDPKYKGYHRHHIDPIYVGGTDDDSNLEWLTPQAHATAHYVRYLKYGDIRDLAAAHILSGIKSPEVYTQMAIEREARHKERMAIDPEFKEKYINDRRKAIAVLHAMNADGSLTRKGLATLKKRLEDDPAFEAIYKENRRKARTLSNCVEAWAEMYLKLSPEGKAAIWEKGCQTRLKKYGSRNGQLGKPRTQATKDLMSISAVEKFNKFPHLRDVSREQVKINRLHELSHTPEAQAKRTKTHKKLWAALDVEQRRERAKALVEAGSEWRADPENLKLLSTKAIEFIAREPEKAKARADKSAATNRTPRRRKEAKKQFANWRKTEVEAYNDSQARAAATKRTPEFRAKSSARQSKPVEVTLSDNQVIPMKSILAALQEFGICAGPINFMLSGKPMPGKKSLPKYVTCKAEKYAGLKIVAIRYIAKE